MADEEEFKIGKRCYVSNLAWRTSWQDLKDHFRQVGNVVYSQVMKDADGYSRGWGIVEFSEPEEALKAVEQLNDSVLEGRNILVREDREDRDVKDAGERPGPRRAPRGGLAGDRGVGRMQRGRGRSTRGRAPPPGRGAGRGEGSSSGYQVVVHGLPYSYDWRNLKDMFQEDFAVDRADIVSSSDGRSKGFGTVRFETVEDAQAAITKFDGKELEGRPLQVKLDSFA